MFHVRSIVASSPNLSRGFRMGSQKVYRALSASVAIGILAATASACLSRPVAETTPELNFSFSFRSRTSKVDKIDVILAIDDSGSMGDKQKFLAKAVPNLIARLVTPACVDANRKPTGKLAVVDAANPEGTCDGGAKPAFRPITDIHIGVLTSSMGNFGSYANCDDPQFGPPTNLHGRLMNDTRMTVKHEPSGFLAYFPDSEANTRKRTEAGFVPPTAPYTSAAELQTAVETLVGNVGERGCGFEAQLESMYHFLVQPDPWSEIARDGVRASYKGLDTEVLEQRRAFLRPDSLVAVVLLSDENDSSPDPLSVNGVGWAYGSPSWPINYDLAMPLKDRTPTTRNRSYTAPGGSECDDRSSETCLPCWDGRRIGKAGCETTLNAEDDPINLRFYDMKRRFGVSPQFPVNRYIRGLRDPKVPARADEHAKNGSYEEAAGACTNPLFASELPSATAPDLCHLPPGIRDPKDVFFAVIGGIPDDLATAITADPSPAAWGRVLAPLDERNLRGVDVRMVPLDEPRTPDGLARHGYDPASVTGDAASLAGVDWDPHGQDLTYACTFDLPEAFRTKATASDHASSSYDCSKFWDPPLCDKPLAGNENVVRQQVKGKAYPTPRELAVARGLGGQGIVASICARSTSGSPTAPEFGYNPAVATIVDRLTTSLAGCLPEPLDANPTGEVPCVALERLREPGPESICDAPELGRRVPDAAVLERYRAELRAASATPDPATFPICEILQRPVALGATCAANEPGFCYTSGVSGQLCAQAIVYAEKTFDAGEKFRGATVDLRCSARL